jgi:hypothetical protein
MRLKIGPKFLGTLAVVVPTILLVAWTGFSGLGRVRHEVDAVFQRELVGIQLLRDATTELSDTESEANLHAYALARRYADIRDTADDGRGTTVLATGPRPGAHLGLPHLADPQHRPARARSTRALPRRRPTGT